MTVFGLDELMQIMRECAGEDEAAQFGGDLANTEFNQLGYDSLALMETASQVARRLDISLPEEEFARVETPAQLLALINERLSARSGPQAGVAARTGGTTG
ncbi:acyl carrier protein [Micromonospora sp. NPDC049559]|uniref:acyl carrier protein n=1 Tax=Micromonospora sp. NPDC049559 TaxID=3155923 RepID=UPI003416CCC2